MAHRRRIVKLCYAHARTTSPPKTAICTNNSIAMKLDTTAPEQTMSSMAGPSHGKLDSRADPCPQAEDDDSAAKYLFKLSHDVILSLDRIGTILCINQRGVHLSGYSESELRGANVFELLLLPEDRQVAREMLADVAKG